jgi:FkbM family methyltransferase
MLWRALKHVGQGFYIDVGASHPDIDSVTRAFYDRGWHGINIEPTANAHRRLLAARPRDLNLRLAVGAKPGTATFFAVDDVNSGLSTLDTAAAARYGTLGMSVSETTTPVETLAALCERYAPTDIHFLKIDVEGAERDVLLGADFTRFRPWVICIEATAPMTTIETHAEWEPILLDAEYRFVWFDGLNRFYVPAERHDALAPAFRTPPNVFDDFVRAADTEWTRRIAEAEGRADATLQRARDAEHRAAVAEDRAEAAMLRLATTSIDATRLRIEAADKTALANRLEQDLAHATARSTETARLAADAEHARAQAAAWLDAMRRSTSWRVTEPLRRVTAFGRRQAGPPGTVIETIAPPAPEPATAVPSPAGSQPPIALQPQAGAPRRAVHQFHSGTAVGDAITNAMLLTRRVLRDLGYDSRIFAEHRDPSLAHEIHSVDDLPRHDRYVLIVRHSMGHDALDRVIALPARKVLCYHNITPPELLEGAPFMQQYARIGRQQLQQLRTAVDATITDSAYNTLELLRLGITPVATCTMLFDVDAMLAAAPPRQPIPRLFTILFVGRVTASKGQMALVDAFARFRTLFDRDARLVLVGRHDDLPYVTELFSLVRRRNLDNGAVEITGLISDDELRLRYAQADLYVSLSAHEGFGVPLIEAVANGVPVLANAAGAIPYTLPDGMLPDATPATATRHMLALAQDPAARARLLDTQRAAIRRFALGQQTPILIDAIVKAGAARPHSPALHADFAANARFTIAGHVNGTYSLAEVNRQLALTIEAERPGAVRIIPIEGDVTTNVANIPNRQRSEVSRLLARPAPETGPAIVITQHYPVWLPPEPGDLPLAFFFWEESLVPATTIATLNDNFAGVLAPASTVAKALLESGLRIPVRVVGYTPRLEAFHNLRTARAARPNSGPFTFLHVSSCFPRKGVDILLAAYARAFDATSNVRLVIKGFPNPHNTVATDLARIVATHPGMAPVELVDRDLNEDDLLALYQDADAMVLPTRGEGYNLPAAEALAAGIPLIVTGWGGHMDTLAAAPPKAVRLLDFQFAPSTTHLATPFSLWAEPSVNDLVAALQEAASAGRTLTEQPTPGTSPRPTSTLSGRIAHFAADLLLAPPQPPLTTGCITTWNVPCGIAEYARHLVTALPGPVTIFADLRTEPSAHPGAAPVLPCWRPADPPTFAALMGAIVRDDPRAIILQHQPGLMPWTQLPAVLTHPALHGRVVVVAMHNTQDLAEAPPAIRATAVAALSRMSRLIVHTIRDLNNLAAIGLAATAMLIPQGAEPARQPRPVKDLAPDTLPNASPDAPVVIGCYGFFLPEKGIPQLVEALAILRTTWPAARLRLVNAEYPMPQSVAEIAASRALTEHLGLTDAIEFNTGFLDRETSLALLRSCDIIALPYQQSREGSSAALRGALVTGVPVAVTPLPLFDEADAAVLRLPGVTPAEIAHGLDRILRDRPARQAAVDASTTWLAAREWTAIGPRWHALLEALSASGLVVAPGPVLPITTVTEPSDLAPTQ